MVHTVVTETETQQGIRLYTCSLLDYESLFPWLRALNRITKVPRDISPVCFQDLLKTHFCEFHRSFSRKRIHYFPVKHSRIMAKRKSLTESHYVASGAEAEQ